MDGLDDERVPGPPLEPHPHLVGRLGDRHLQVFRPQLRLELRRDQRLQGVDRQAQLRHLHLPQPVDHRVRLLLHETLERAIGLADLPLNGAGWC